MTETVIALLGKRDMPTDGVAEYCDYLGAALRAHEFDLKIKRVAWSEEGWSKSLQTLRQESHCWRGKWVLVQYTALAWSSRGFPLRFRNILRILGEAGARIGVILHDVEPYLGSRPIDKMRRMTQLHTMKSALGNADLAVFTIPLEKISWLRRAQQKSGGAVFIPVGANIPTEKLSSATVRSGAERRLRIAIYGITGGKNTRPEVEEIVNAVRAASGKAQSLEVSAFGRHADDGESQLRDGLRDLPVDVRVQGLLPAERVEEELRSSDVLLFVRGQISSRRGSAIAGIACGLPVVAYRGSETAPPITEAGVVLVSRGNAVELGEALTRVLTDESYREALAAKSVAAQEKYFSWEAIAKRFAEEFGARGNPRAK
jgi:glycosyltransferase involved in cell wall biosynthesis